MARKVKVSDEKEFAATITAAIASGENPVTAINNALDSDHDGRVTFGELRQHRWKLVMVAIGFMGATLLWKWRELWDFLNDNWIAVLSTVIAFVAGWFFSWMFRQELTALEEKMEDMTPSEMVFRGAATAGNAALAGDPTQAFTTAAQAPALATAAMHQAAEDVAATGAAVAAAAAVPPNQVNAS